MNFLITGGAGFIGSHMADALLARGDTVCLLDDISTGSTRNIAHLLADPRVRFVEGTIMDEPLIRRLTAEADVVVHNCEDLACWLAAERVVKDKAFARPIFRSYPRKDGSTLYHIVTEVRQRDGRVLIEDPSDLQGMR